MFAFTLALSYLVVSSQAQLTLVDVAQHDSANDCWSAIGGDVYDVTSFIPDHPNNKILALCGIDGTALFEKEHGE